MTAEIILHDPVEEIDSLRPASILVAECHYNAALLSKMMDEVEDRGSAIAYVGPLQKCKRLLKKLSENGIPASMNMIGTE
jgi:hypothetical protein